MGEYSTLLYYKFDTKFTTMLQDQFISVTDLRIKTKASLKGLRNKPKYILVNNRPVAVLVDINEYNERMITPELSELTADEVNPILKKQAAAARKSKKADLINIR